MYVTGNINGFWKVAKCTKLANFSPASAIDGRLRKQDGDACV